MTDVKVTSVTFLLNVLKIVIDSVMDPTFHMTTSHSDISALTEEPRQAGTQHNAQVCRHSTFNTSFSYEPFLLNARHFWKKKSSWTYFCNDWQKGSQFWTVFAFVNLLSGNPKIQNDRELNPKSAIQPLWVRSVKSGYMNCGWHLPLLCTVCAMSAPAQSDAHAFVPSMIGTAPPRAPRQWARGQCSVECWT